MTSEVLITFLAIVGAGMGYKHADRRRVKG